MTVAAVQARGSFCTGCGKPVAECPGCTRDLDPPRFCDRCARRLKVQVTPAGYTTTCKTCDGVGAAGLPSHGR